MKNAQQICANRRESSAQGSVRKTRESVGRLLTRRSSGQFYETVVVVWLTLSVASVVLAAATWMRLSRQLNAASEAVAIRLQADSVLQILLEAESSQRAYVVTHDPQFLEMLHGCATNLPGRFGRLTSLSRKDPALLQRVNHLRAQARASLEDQQRIVMAMREHGLAAASSLESSGDGRERLAAIRQEVAALGATPSALIF